MKRRRPFLLLLPIFLPMLALGCSRLGHWKSPVAEAITDGICTLVGEPKTAFAADEAQRLGISVVDVIRGIDRACSLRPGATRADVEREAVVIAASHK